MGAFDRSKFKATSTKKMQKQQDHVENTLGTSKGWRANFLKLKPGKNKVRIFPAHPGTDSFCYPRTTHYLEILAKYQKDGEDVEELKKKPIFNAKVHGNLVNDPIDAYIDRAFRMAYDEIQDEKERTKFLAPILNYREGIKGKTKWVVYACIIDGDQKEYGRLELPVTVKDSMNELAIGADDDDDVIETDPFTDPDEGRCIIVKYNNKAEKPQDYYKTSIDLKKATPLNDEELNWLLDQPSLQSILVDAYSMKDFDMAVEGLKRFDEDKGYEIFTFDDYLDTLEIIAKQVPEKEEKDEEEDEDTPPATKKRTKDDVVKESKKKEKEVESDLPFDKSLDEMTMDELKGVIRREDLGIRILSKYDEEGVIEMIMEERELKAGESSKESEEAEEAEEEEEEEKPTRRRSSRLDKLANEVEED